MALKAHESLQGSLAMRPPSEVMRLARMGSFHPMRLSFSRQLLRRMAGEGWVIDIPRWQMDENGVGQAVIRATTPDRVFCLAAFTHALADHERSDRVIAERWDATFSLVEGEPDDAAMQRMAETVARQEAGRQSADQLTLSRANKSLRMFDHVVGRLAEGAQPDATMVNSIGYVMRTTAVYGNGKFGIGDRDRMHDCQHMLAPFQAEMLTVYLIRHFSLELIDHLARQAGGDRAVALDRNLARHFGIGNATGLGMAPFLVNHQELLHRWMAAREAALARVLSQPELAADKAGRIRHLVARARIYAAQWRVDDQIQMARITELEDDLAHIAAWLDDPAWAQGAYPLKALFDRVGNTCSVEAAEIMVSILMEPFGELVDDLGDAMGAEEHISVSIAATVAEARAAVDAQYRWAARLDLSDLKEDALFWYVSEAKLEPRLGHRHEEDGAEREMPFDIAHQIQRLGPDLDKATPEESLAGFMLRHPEHRHILRRVMQTLKAPYGEIRDNLVAASTRPIDMLRCKLSFFGASKFDPKSDLWTRISLFQGAPLADELGLPDADDWLLATLTMPQ